MSTAFVRGVAAPGLVAALVLAGLGVPARSASARETETVNRTAAFTPGSTLTVRNFSGRVTITGTDRTDVSVAAVRRAPRERLDRIKLDVREENGGVVIEANKQDEPKRRDENVVETDLTIEVPRKANLDVQTFSSPVTARDIVGTSHRVKTFSGDQQLERVTGRIDADAFSGRIQVSPAWNAGDRFSLHTFSGGVEVQVPGSAGGPVEFKTFSGDFSSDLPLTVRSKEKRSVHGELSGDAKGELRIQTFSGDARLRK
jgi:hypothetical protein